MSTLTESQSIPPEPSQKTDRQWNRGPRGRFVAGPRSYEWLLQHTTIRDWIDGYTSQNTREKKLYQVEQVIKASGLGGPSELLALSDRDIKTLVKRLANQYLQRGKNVWARQITITMKGFLESQDRRLELRRSERIRTSAGKKIAIEHIPSKGEVYKMADWSGSFRSRAVILCLFQSGVRVSCLCNWTFGLISQRLKVGTDETFRIRVTPAMDTKLHLYGLPYYVTGLQKEASERLREYINYRVKSGWTPRPNDPIFVSNELPTKKMTRAMVWRTVKSAARTAGLDPASVWVHCLRKAFRKVLNATPQIDEDTKEALMGHRLPGSRGSYFDYHDEDEVMSKYMQADFSRPDNFANAFTPALSSAVSNQLR